MSRGGARQRISRALALPATLAACTALPPDGPSVLMVPPRDKSIPRFQAEDLSCRQHASDELTQMMTPPVSDDEQNPADNSISYAAASLQPIYDRSYVKCMSAYGNTIPPESYLRHYGYPYPYRYSYVFPYPYDSKYPYPYPPAFPYPYGYPW